MKKYLLLIAICLISSMSWSQTSAYYKSLMSDALITDASQLSSNASDGDEGQHIEYLIDGNANTFWHTDWHNVCTDQYHYLQVALGQEYTGDIVLAMTRRNTGNDHPTKMIVWGSKDNAAYTEIETVSLPYEGMGTVAYAKFTCDDYSYLRFAASDCSGESGNPGYRTFWHAAEFQLYKAKELVKVPDADLMNIQFNADNTATDISPLANEINPLGTPKVVKSPKYNMNILCNADNEWGEVATSTFTFPFSDALKAGIEDGFTIEMLVRPLQGGEYVNNGQAIGWEAGGGTGILIDGRTWRFETRSGGSYHTAVWNQVPPKGDWLHFVGVWSKEEGMCYFYVNGEEVAHNNAAGDYGWPSDEVLLGYLGADFNHQTSQYSMSGDIAIVRMYNDPLAANQVSTLYTEIQAMDTGADEHEDTEVKLDYDEDGWFNISTPEDLCLFSSAVHVGDIKAKARLTADIDMADHCDNFKPIGVKKCRFSGTFDGQGHKISNLVVDQEEDCAGLFGYIQSPCTIQNVVLDATCSIHGYAYSGMIGKSATAGTIYLTNLGNEGPVSTTAQNAGGILGNNESSAATIIMTNCYCTGAVSGNIECGALSGWLGSNPVTITNCWSTSEIQGYESDEKSFARCGGSATFTNCYFKNETSTQVSQLTDELLSSGELVYILNGGYTENPLWYQTIGQDSHPVFDSTHGYVVPVANSYVSVTNENLSDCLTKICNEANTFAGNAAANGGLIANLQKAIETLSGSQNRNEFYTNYNAFMDARQTVEDNEDAYTAFQQFVAETLTTLGDTPGDAAQTLRVYLSDAVEPSETYPNGTATYIIENKTMTDEGLQTERQYISDLLKRAVSSSALAGTDVTVLLTNADFSQQGSGWSGSMPNNYNSNPAAAEFTSNSGDVYQTATEIKNGIYELDMNAFGCAHGDKMNASFIGSIYTNDVDVPVMSVIEGKLPIENAQDGVNCYITTPGTAPYDMIADETSYIPQSTQGGAIALNGGRYLNRILVNVTDGQLKIGARMDGSNTGNDWMMMANTKLIYQGTVAEAGDALTNVLSGMSDRAKTLIAFQASSSGTDYLYYPNCSAAVKAALQACVDEIATTTDNEAKYQLIQKMSSLFQQSYAERMAYKNLATTLEWYYGCISEYESMAATIEANYSAGWDGWTEGKYSAQEATKLTNTLLHAFDSPAEEVPAADLLDVVFNADGTATDVSASQREVVMQGSPVVKHSPMLDLNVFCSAKTTIWGSAPISCYRVAMTDELWSKISDGVTYEAYVRSYGHKSDWCGVIGYEESGGIGLITDAQKWCMEAHLGGGYKEAYGAEPVDGEWIHLVGVYDKEAGSLKLYVNGSMAAETSVSGDMKTPNIKTTINDMIIGADLDGSDGSAQAAFSGDIAIARIYDQPLNSTQIMTLWSNVASLNTGAAEHDEEAEDAIHNIQITPAATDVIFNLMGQKLAKAQRGINIINGEKVLVK